MGMHFFSYYFRHIKISSFRAYYKWKTGRVVNGAVVYNKNKKNPRVGGCKKKKLWDCPRTLVFRNFRPENSSLTRCNGGGGGVTNRRAAE